MRTLLLLTLALSACVVPKIVGDNPEADTGKDSDTPEDTGDEATLGATSQPDASTGANDDTTGSKFDMMPPPDVDPGDCAAPTLEACEANPACMPVFGEAEDFEGCIAGPQYLGCLPQMPCDAVLLTVCDVETNEVFHLTNGCIPEGFAACEGTGVLCGAGGDDCIGLDEPDCTAKGCTTIFGAPHVTINDAECADYDALEFLACLPPDTACPPVIAILCPTGQDSPAWDVPSGCQPEGFETCDEMLVPACE